MDRLTLKAYAIKTAIALQHWNIENNVKVSLHSESESSKHCVDRPHDKVLYIINASPVVVWAFKEPTILI